MLRPYGYAVDHFESAEPALVALVQDSYDLLLTDLKVSPKGMDGDDLVRALRNSGHDKISDMPVIVITGATDSDILAQVYDAGANHILTKPVNGDELDAEIRKLVFARKHAEADSDNQTKVVEPSLGATVVPFGAEPKKQANSNDNNIPVLKTETSLNTSDDNLSRESSPAPQLKAETRRYLGPLDDAGHSSAEKGLIHEPVPATIHKPAARVKPTVKVKTKSVTLKASTDTAPAAESSKIDLQRRAAALKEQQKIALRKVKNPATKSVPQQASLVSKRKGKAGNDQAGAKPAVNANEKAEALRKVKAAIAAKKAKLDEQQRAIEQQLQRDPTGKTDEVLSKLSSDSLSLEPAADGLGDDFQQTGVKARQASKNTGTKGQAARSFAQPVEQNQSVDQVQEKHQNKVPKVDDVLEAFQQTGTNRSDILRTMEQYPLVEADLGNNFSPSRVLRMANSVLELYGPKRILTGIALLGVLFVAYGYWSSVIDDGVPVDVTTVEQGEIFQSITVPGRVVSKLKVNMTPAIAGRITKIYVDEGDQVKSGDLLASLDDREAKSYLKRTMANLESAKEDVVLAERSLKRLKQAFDKGAVARQMVEESQVELRSARARESIASEEVRTAKLSLENPRVVAPFSGTVTARHIEVGQWVVPSETLLTLVDESQREIEVKVDAADSGGIAVGQTVNISSDAFPGMTWSEAVTRLAAATNNVGNANTVSVYISLGSNAPSLRFGQQVDADIRTAWNPNALKVPYGAIVNKNGHTYVIVIEKGKAHYVQVETGIEDFSHVEILQGVNIGQTVILANGQDIENGQKVYLAANNR